MSLKNSLVHVFFQIALATILLPKQILYETKRAALNTIVRKNIPKIFRYGKKYVVAFRHRYYPKYCDFLCCPQDRKLHNHTIIHSFTHPVAVQPDDVYKGSDGIVEGILQCAICDCGADYVITTYNCYFKRRYSSKIWLESAFLYIVTQGKPSDLETGRSALVKGPHFRAFIEL